MSKVQANGIAIEIEDTGADRSQTDRPVVLLIMGLGMQLIAWPPEFVQALQDAGYRVVRMDNRDVGLSQHFDHLGTPNLLWESLKLKFGFGVKAGYSLKDMAADALGVLDALGVAQAHVIGVSMGAMIAQRVALAAPERVLSLTSIMGSSGGPSLPGPQPQVLRALFSRPQGTGEDAVVEHFVRLFRAIGSPAFPQDEDELRERLRGATRRSFHPAGTMRQMAAVAADATRAAELAQLRLPVLVVHGRDDPLIPFACGQDTARRIAGARFVAVAGMGHDLPPGVIEHILEPLIPHLEFAQERV